MATLRKSKNNHITRIFTDGACSGNPGIGGWASVILSNKKVHKVAGHDLSTTNNRMEILAVIWGLKYAKKYGLTKVHIYSDSAYVVNAITNGWLITWRSSQWMKADKTEVKNSDLWKKLYKLLISDDFEEIKFHKVKGHSGNHFNEMADSLAKEEVKKGRLALDGTRN